MIKEKYVEKTSQLAVNIENNRVESVRRKDITKTAIRVYSENKLGVAGGLGKIDEEELTERAVKALDFNKLN